MICIFNIGSILIDIEFVSKTYTMFQIRPSSLIALIFFSQNRSFSKS